MKIAYSWWEYWVHSPPRVSRRICCTASRFSIRLHTPVLPLCSSVSRFSPATLRTLRDQKSTLWPHSGRNHGIREADARGVPPSSLQPSRVSEHEHFAPFGKCAVSVVLLRKKLTAARSQRQRAAA
jgi:hypothetical protein